MIKEIFERNGTGIMVAFSLMGVLLCFGCWMIVTFIIYYNNSKNATILDPGILSVVIVSYVLSWFILFLLWSMYPEECPKCAIEIEETIYKCYNCGSTNMQKIKDYKIWCKDCGKINARR